MTESKSTLPYYGWFVLAASALCEMLAQGATSYGAGLFVLPLQAEFHLSRANASSSILILFVGAAFLAPGAGRLLDRVPIRGAVMVGAVCFSLALAIIAMTNSLMVMALALLVPASLGFALLGPMATSTLASRWFFRHRGLALGIAAVATSGGGILVVPALSAAIQAYGWRHALLVEAFVFFIVVTALALLVLKDNPYRAGLGEHPENKGRTDRALLLAGANAGTPQEKISWRRILSRRDFWAPSLMMASISGVAQVIVVSLPAYAHQLRFTVASGALLISIFSLAAAATKIFFGVAADYWDKRILLFLSGLFMPLALVLMCLSASYPVILVACIMAGIALGGALPLSYGLIAARFGAGHFGSVIGWSYTLLLLFLIVAVRFAGTMFDRNGTYLYAFEGLLAVLVLLFIVSLLLDSRFQPQG